MAQSTRSHGSVSIDSESDKKQKNIDDREKSSCSETPHAETTKRANDPIDANSLFNVLSQIQSELSQLRRLPEQVNSFEQRMNEASRAASAYDECINEPMREESTVVMSTLKLKDVVANVPNFDGYKISVFQFARVCKRAKIYYCQYKNRS